jgi:hypothetical protein
VDRAYQNAQGLSIRTLVENLCCLFGVRIKLINYIFAGLLSVISQGGGFMASGQEWTATSILNNTRSFKLH